MTDQRGLLAVELEDEQEQIDLMTGQINEGMNRIHQQDSNAKVVLEVRIQKLARQKDEQLATNAKLPLKKKTSLRHTAKSN